MNALSLFFLTMRSKPQDSVGNDCYDLAILYLNVGDIASITLTGVDFSWIIHNISKYEAINLFKIILCLRIMVIYKNACQKNQC